MLRAPLLYLSHAGWAKNVVSHWGLARRVVRRFVAGETEDDAINAVRTLRKQGMTVTIDVLGESVTSAGDANAAADAYLRLLERLNKEGLEGWVSLKLTALGLNIDEMLCETNLRRVVDCARSTGAQVTIDMEDTPYTQKTLDLFNRLRADGCDNLRTVIQAYLYRSDADVAALVESGAGIRLCKGAYKEPPSLAYPSKKDVDAAYLRQARALLDGAHAGKGYPGLATHDEAIIEAARAYAKAQGISPDRYEFQMLYGVRSALQETLRAEGYGMRVYVPFGTQWYPYFMRRLAERPANLWFFASNFFRR